MILRVLLSASVLALAGCTPNIKTVNVDSAKIQARVDLALKCAHRIAEVEDQRPDGDLAGAYGWNALKVEDATTLVRKQLISAGLSETDGRPVTVDLMRIYLHQNLYTSLPIVVYRVRVDGDEPFVIRSQIGSMAWSGDVKNAYQGYSAAMRDANTRMIDQLNLRCGCWGVYASPPACGRRRAEWAVDRPVACERVAAMVSALIGELHSAR